MEKVAGTDTEGVIRDERLCELSATAAKGAVPAGRAGGAAAEDAAVSDGATVVEDVVAGWGGEFEGGRGWGWLGSDGLVDRGAREGRVKGFEIGRSGEGRGASDDSDEAEGTDKAVGAVDETAAAAVALVSCCRSTERRRLPPAKIREQRSIRMR